VPARENGPEDPPPMRRFNPHVSRDLDAIVASLDLG